MTQGELRKLITETPGITTKDMGAITKLGYYSIAKQVGKLVERKKVIRKCSRPNNAKIVRYYPIT